MAERQVVLHCSGDMSTLLTCSVRIDWMHALHSASMQIHDVLTHQDMVPMAIGVARDAAVSREGESCMPSC